MAPRLEQAVKVWHLVVSLSVVVLGGAFTAGSAWASLNSHLETAQQDVKALAEVKQRGDDVEETWRTKVNDDLSTVKNDIMWIKNALGGKTQ